MSIRAASNHIAVRAVAAAVLAFACAVALCAGMAPAAQAAVKKPAQVKSVKVVAKGKTTAKATWKKVSKAKGYQLRFSKKSTMKSAKTITTSKAHATVKGLKAGTKYYVQVRAYKKSGSKKVWGKWSAKKAVTTKKSASTAAAPTAPTSQTGQGAAPSVPSPPESGTSSGSKSCSVHSWVVSYYDIPVEAQPASETETPTGRTYLYCNICGIDGPHFYSNAEQSAHADSFINDDDRRNHATWAGPRTEYVKVTVPAQAAWTIHYPLYATCSKCGAVDNAPKCAHSWIDQVGYDKDGKAWTLSTYCSKCGEEKAA